MAPNWPYSNLFFSVLLTCFQVSMQKTMAKSEAVYFPNSVLSMFEFGNTKLRTIHISQKTYPIICRCWIIIVLFQKLLYILLLKNTSLFPLLSKLVNKYQVTSWQSIRGDHSGSDLLLIQNHPKCKSITCRIHKLQANLKCLWSKWKLVYNSNETSCLQHWYFTNSNMEGSENFIMHNQ